MSAQSVDVSIDLAANRAEGSVSFAIDELFVDGELRLRETADGWAGYRIEDGAYYYVNTTRGDWAAELRVGAQAVRDGVLEYLRETVAVPGGPA